MIHELKTWPEYFEEVELGNKTFEVRNNDRNFQVGDQLILKEYDPVGGGGTMGFYTGNELNFIVTYVLKSSHYEGIQSGFCVLGMKPL